MNFGGSQWVFWLTLLPLDCGVINHFSLLSSVEREYQNVILNRKQKYFDIFTDRPRINGKDM